MRKHQTSTNHGFTLIEIIGVLAIMSILAATLAPSAIQMITASKQTAEDSSLTAISDALRLFVKTSKIIPDKTTWATDIASLLNTAPTKVTTNGNNGKRIYLYPDNFFATGTSLPYNQKNASMGTLPTTLTNPRIMVISNLNSSTPLTQTSAQLTAATFDNIWKQTGIFNAELKESTMLKIARINLTDLFQVNFLHSDLVGTATYPASILVDGLPTSPYYQLTTASIQPYLIQGSVLTLGYLNAGSFVTLSKSTVQKPENFYYTGSTTTANLITWGFTRPSGSLTTATAISALTSTPSGIFNQWAPNAACTSTGNYTLKIDNWSNSQNDDYYLYVGDLSGSISFPPSIQKNGTPPCQGGDNKARTGEVCKWNIAECSMVIIVPRVKRSPANIYMFYMPNATKSVIVQ
ncbi:MAG: type II secretion system protein [Mariprofundales bacterium]|nr:type II secretion system protein [Mariprofundales bacterium]